MLTDVLGSSVSGVVLSDIVERAVSEITVASLDVLMRIHSDTVVASVQFKVMFGNIRTLEEFHVRIAASDELRRFIGSSSDTESMLAKKLSGA